MTGDGDSTWRRRRLLRAAAPALTLVAGCGASPGNETGDTPTTTGSTASPSPTETPAPDPSKLSPSATVVKGPSEVVPLTLRLGLQNEHDFEVGVAPRGRAAPLAELPRMTGETVDLVLVPAEDPGAGVTYPDLASSPVDGCWRFVDTEGNTPTRAPVSTHLAATLAPGETYAIRHEVYHDGDSETCFPGDPYRTSAAVVFVAPGGRSEPFAFTYTLSVGGDGEPTVAVDGPERLTDEE